MICTPGFLGTRHLTSASASCLFEVKLEGHCHGKKPLERRVSLSMSTRYTVNMSESQIDPDFDADADAVSGVTRWKCCGW